MTIGHRNGRHRHLRSFLVVTVFGLRRDLEHGIPRDAADRTPGHEVLPDEIQSQGSPRRRHIDHVGALTSVAPPLEAVPESGAHGNRPEGIDADAFLVVRGVDRVRQVPGPAVDFDPRLVDVSVDHEERTRLETGFVGRPAAQATDALDGGRILGFPVPRRGIVHVPIRELEAAVRLRDRFELDRRPQGMEAAARFRAHCHMTRTRWRGAGEELLLYDEAGLVPGDIRVGRDRPLGTAAVVPAPEDVPLRSERLRGRGLQHVFATGSPFERGGCDNAVPVNDNLQPRWIRRDRCRRRRHSVQSGHSVDIPRRQPCRRPDRHAGRNRVDSSGVVHHRGVVVLSAYRAVAGIQKPARPRAQLIGNLNVSVPILALVFMAQTYRVPDFVDRGRYPTALGAPKRHCARSAGPVAYKCAAGRTRRG